MRVFGWATDAERHWTAPFPAHWLGGIKLRLMGGDVLDPVRGTFELRPGVEPGTELNWFNAVPRAVHRYFQSRRCLPFFSFGLGRFGGYIGWKVFGVDQPAYLDYPQVAPGDVYDRSRAMCPTARLTRARPRRDP